MSDLRAHASGAARALEARWASISATTASIGLRLAVIVAEEGGTVVMSPGCATARTTLAQAPAGLEIGAALLSLHGDARPDAVACLVRPSIAGRKPAASPDDRREALGITFVRRDLGAAFALVESRDRREIDVVRTTRAPFACAYRLLRSHLRKWLQPDSGVARLADERASGALWLQIEDRAQTLAESPADDASLAQPALSLGRDIVRTIRAARSVRAALQ